MFITPRLHQVPGALLHNLKHNQVLHKRVIFLRVDVQDVPFVPLEKRLTVKKLGKGFYSVEMHFDFFQTPDVPQALESARIYGLSIDVDTTTFFVRRETPVSAYSSPLPKWQGKLFRQVSTCETQRYSKYPALPLDGGVEHGCNPTPSVF